MSTRAIHTVAVVGAGNVAHALVPVLHAAGVQVVQIRARNPDAAQALAAAVGAAAVPLHAALPSVCDLLLLAVKDDALAEVVALQARLPLPASLIVAHTSGSVPLSILAPAQRPHGVFYPLQTFTRGRPVDWQTIPLLQEADSDETLQALRDLARRLGPRVETMDSETRRRVHLGAVFASNFVNHLLHIAGHVGGDYRRYLPLLTEVVSKLHELTPAQAQTGPAKRGDQLVIEQQRFLLANEFPDLVEVYNQLTAHIRATETGAQSIDVSQQS